MLSINLSSDKIVCTDGLNPGVEAIVNNISIGLNALTRGMIGVNPTYWNPNTLK